MLLKLRTFYDLGYAVEWRVINAGDYGFPQKRRRVFIFAYHKSTKYYDKMDKIDYQGLLFEKGIFAQSFPIENNALEITETNIDENSFKYLVDISDNFDFHFYNTGRMNKGHIYSIKSKPNCIDRTTLNDILENDSVDDKYMLTGEKLEKWKYLKGSKKIQRKRPNGETYCYSEGAIPFPDNLDSPARTMLTSESSVNRSSHVVVDKCSGNLRIITPIEAERINMFPDNWTNIKKDSMTERRRYFMMGNALVVGVISRLGEFIGQIIDDE